MDPITGIGLAASVTQLVSFGIGAAKTCREIYEQGVSDDHSQLDYVATHLGHLTMSIRQSLQNTDTQSLRLSKEERELVSLSWRCQKSADQLQTELKRLRTKPRTSIVSAASKAARALWKKNSIEQIQKQLESYRSTLEVSLLSRLSQRFDAQALRNAESFATLDRSLQHIIACLAKSETTLAIISVQEAEQTRQHTAAQIGHLERLYFDDRRFEEVTRSLFYPEIFSRQEQIANVFDGIESSYDWIFDKPRTRKVNNAHQTNSPPRAPLWSDFACWLKSGHGVYWINGKAGSGKSTLMNHICGHNRKRELLQEWSLHRRLLTPSFFFWNSGSRQQKTIDGLLRSLIYQMLIECRQLITCFEDTHMHAWTESRLLTVLSNLLRQTQVDVAICMFIDGLDEFDGRYDSVIKMITNVSDQEHVKICVSSRPLLAFRNAFSKNPCLRLQDLTYHSIRDYVNLQLSPLVQQTVSSNDKARQKADRLIDIIVQRADGVFLWAVIATREFRDGLQGMADLDELEHAIEVLPPELESLFMLVLKRIKPAFQRDAARFLQIVLCADHMRAFDLCQLYLISSQDGSQDAPFIYKNVAMSELSEACRTLETRLLSHTASLLELTPTNGMREVYCKRKDWDQISFTEVYFIHRTVRDFLMDNNEAKSFLKDYGLSEAQVHLCIARGKLAYLFQHAEGDAVMLHEDEYAVNWPHPMLRPFQDVLRHVAIAERLFRRAQTKLVQSLDYASLVRGYTLPTGPPYVFEGACQAFLKDGAGISIDIVGMAAAAGMTIYVCERLGLSVSSAGYSPSLPDLESYSTSRAVLTYLFWKKLDELPDMAPRGHTPFGGSSYRQALSKCLPWGEDGQVEDEHTENHPLAETYILCCCEPTSIDLVRILLNAGANPMVQVQPMAPEPIWYNNTGSFWSSWLLFLKHMRDEYRNVHGKPEGMILMKVHDRTITLDDVFDVTKALLAHGADVNFPLGDNYALKCRSLAHSYFRLDLSATAMFILEECFNNEPEFQEFAVAISPLIKRPTREIVGIRHYHHTSGHKVNSTKCGVSPDDSRVLWPLIEKWERTGQHEKGKTALEMAVEQIYDAHNLDKASKEGLKKAEEEESGRESEEGYRAESEEDVIV